MVNLVYYKKNNSIKQENITQIGDASVWGELYPPADFESVGGY